MMLIKFFRRFWENTGGSVLVYTAMFGGIAIAGGALAVDIGQIILLKSEMQHRADAGALAGARQLDGRDGAQIRAQAVATSAMLDSSGITGGNALPVSSVDFFSSLDPLEAATSDIDAHFLRVTLNTQQVSFLMAPVLGMFTGSSRETTDVDALATAGSNPRVCEAPPLMICDFRETDPADDLALSANYGRQVRLKEPQGGGNQAWAPGNFGLLALPDGAVGAPQIEGQLAAVEPLDCYDVDVETATGSKTQKVKDGINSRFDVVGNPWPFPAPNVIAYPRDDTLIADASAKLGSGVWDINTYWNDRHGGAVTPAVLVAASRYQVYLYEQGEDFWRNGKRTIYPVPGGAIDPGYTLVSSAGTVDIPEDLTNPTDPYVDGLPSQPVASNGNQRRVMKIAQLQCIADNVHGHGSYPTHGNFIEIFITEPVQDPPEAAIYGEVIRALTASNSVEYYANVGLLE